MASRGNGSPAGTTQRARSAYAGLRLVNQPLTNWSARSTDETAHLQTVRAERRRGMNYVTVCTARSRLSVARSTYPPSLPIR